MNKLAETVIFADRAYTVPELAKETRRSRDKIYQYCRCSDPLPHVKDGKNIVIHWSSWVMWSERNLGPGGRFYETKCSN